MSRHQHTDALRHWAKSSSVALKITFLIRSLGRGGAEAQLVALAVGLRKAGHDVSVITFYGNGPHEDRLRDAGVVVLSLNKSGRWDLIRAMVSLVRTTRKIKPHLLHGYMPTGNILALAVRPFLGDTKVAWGVRGSLVDLGRYDAVTRISYQVERGLARFADLLVANSEAGAEHYRQVLAGRTPVVVVHNGFDPEEFAPDPNARARYRAELGVGADELVIGMVARIDPMKDHDTFLEAAALANRHRADLRFVCVGSGAGELVARLRSKAEALGLGARVLWMGERGDVAALYNAFDITTLPSAFGEGFPNVVAEAMACGVPCVVTDVGAAAEIVGDLGVVVPPRDAAALAAGWLALLERQGEAGPALRQATQQRVKQRFGLEALAQRSLAAFRMVAPDA